MIWDTSTVITHDRNVVCVRGGGGEGESDYKVQCDNLHTIPYRELLSSEMLQELSHMDKITRLQDEIQQVHIFSHQEKFKCTERITVVVSFS